MDFYDLLATLKDAGYWALFFVLWLGFFGAPFPNEVIVLTSGWISNQFMFKPIPTFLVTHLGILCSLNTLYVFGRLKKKRKKQKTTILNEAISLVEKHGALALFTSYWFPGLRHMVPFLLGLQKVPYRLFFLYSWFASLIWLSVYFSIGFVFSASFFDMKEWMIEHAWISASGSVLILLIFTSILYKRRKSTVKENTL
ncbi:DedA family protein [Jeotgalibacillus marinus]|uniref:DedA family protein n=1 Tax=Jeotgalibacillus marinus TaxID=86667 RepID=A0ABV3Q640_9BACL